MLRVVGCKHGGLDGVDGCLDWCRLREVVCVQRV